MKPQDQDKTEQVIAGADEEQIEKHVTDLMGPAQSLDGVKQVHEVKASDYTAAPASPAITTEAMPSAPELDIKAINEALLAQTEGINTNESVADLDMTAPPVELSAAGGDQPTLEKAVNDIMREDADNALPPEASDTEIPVVMKASLGERIKQAYFKWWDHRIARYTTLCLLAAIVVVTLFVPVVRAAALNAVGVRTSIAVTAIDQSTALPLKNVVLSAGGVETKTNSDGYAKIRGVRLGKQDVRLTKTGFAESKQTVTLGMRTIDLGEIELKPVGTQYTVVLTDYFSGSFVKGVALSSGEATTTSDKQGKAVLTVAPSDDTKLEVVVEKQGYRTEKLSVAVGAAKPFALKLVPAQKEIYVSKESGRYDLYKMDLDGQNKRVLLAGTGRETAALQVMVDSAGKRAALVSTRDDMRNKEGYLLSALTLVDIASGDSEVIEHAEQITLIGWNGTTLVYQQTVAGASAANASRNRIMAYEYADSQRLQLAAANYFSGTVLVGEKLYYVAASIDSTSPGQFARISIDATNKKVLYSGEVWQLYRSDYKTLKFQTPDKWYEYKLGNVAVTESTPPSSFTNRVYLDSTDGKTSIWVDNRDASGALIAYNVADGKERQITMQRGLSEATRLINDQVIVYRTVTANEVVEYAISLAGGEAHRLSTVSALYQR